MKKTLLAMVMAGGCLTVFAQTTTPPRTTTSGSTTNNSVTNSTTDPMNSVTNTQVNSATNNSVNASTSWAPTGTPNWGWNSYGLWNSRTDVNTTGSYRTNGQLNGSTTPTTSTSGIYNGTNTMNGGTTNSGTMNGTMNGTTMNGTTTNGTTMNSSAMNGTTGTTMNGGTTMGMPPATNSMSSTSVNDAYGTPYDNYGTPITAAPMNVQMNFSKEYPTTTGQTYTWNQYGDWYETQYIDKGRLTQYFYDQKGAGYSLSLPVLQTYVPEEIVEKALQKYGSSLYSIGMVKTADGTPAYNIGLLQRGQMQQVHLQESGASATNVWRVEDMTMDGTTNGSMMTNDANATMGTQSSTTTDAMVADDASMKKEDEKETKTKWKENGVKTKIKAGDGKVKIKQKKVDD